MGEDNYIFYVDESGNTGADWVNAKQPLFIQAGWMFKKDNIEYIENKYKYLFDITQADELKSSNVLKKEKNFEIISEAFSNMLHDEMLPLAVIIEKKYLLCAKLVESYMDPEYNNILSYKYLWDRELKMDIANYIYELGLDLQEFNNVYLNHGINNVDKINKLTIIRDSIIAKLDTNSLLYKVFSTIDNKCLELIINEFDCEDKSINSVVTTSLIALLHKVYPFIRGSNCKLEVIYDKLVRFDKVFEHINSSFFAKEEISLKVSDLTLYPNMRNVVGIKMEDSKSNFVIQLADLLCGLLRIIFEKIYNDINLNDVERKWLNYFYCFIDDIRSIDLITSNYYQLKLCSKIFNKNYNYVAKNYDFNNRMIKYLK